MTPRSSRCLNYATAYQMVYRVAKQARGETALVTGANGGVGLALLELLRLEGVTTYGAAGKRSHEVVRGLGGIPIESRDAPVDASLLAVHPSGVDVAYDALGGRFVKQCIRATRRGGHVIGYGFSGAVDRKNNPITLAAPRTVVGVLVGARLRGRKASWYGITMRYRKDKRSFLEDLPKLFDLLAAGKLHPKIAARLPLLDARRANEMLEAGGVDGKIVLLRDVKA